jgi:hypothetical protein
VWESQHDVEWPQEMGGIGFDGSQQAGMESHHDSTAEECAGEVPQHRDKVRQ